MSAEEEAERQVLDAKHDALAECFNEEPREEDGNDEGTGDDALQQMQELEPARHIIPLTSRNSSFAGDPNVIEIP